MEGGEHGLSRCVSEGIQGRASFTATPTGATVMGDTGATRPFPGLHDNSSDPDGWAGLGWATGLLG